MSQHLCRKYTFMCVCVHAHTYIHMYMLCECTTSGRIHNKYTVTMNAAEMRNWVAGEQECKENFL